ncbi:lipase family alpha/beta hydrolase [Acinetobacter gerneri]|uniref:lipase family alpha/beta hydrolase n=1 Tax=Acinetobacter gerneri TaxID=202952 RepID=UPI003A883234
MLGIYSKKIRLFTLFFIMLSLLSGCQIVHLKENRMSTSLSQKSASFLTQHKFSEATLSSLYLLDLSPDYCLDKPEQCASTILKHPSIETDQAYASISEIYLAKAFLLENNRECLNAPKHQANLNNSCLSQQLEMLNKSLRYSYVYLFKTEQSPESRLFDQRQMQVRLFYNVALSKFMTNMFVQQHFDKFPDNFHLNNQRFNLDFKQYTELKNVAIDRIQSTYIMGFSGFYTINRQEGIGSEFVVVKSVQAADDDAKFILDPETYYQKNATSHIHEARYLPVSAVIEPTEVYASAESILNGADLQIKLIDPYQYQSTEINQKKYKITANYSAPFGLWLAENKISEAGYWSLFNREQRLVMPHLFMLEPYQPNKKIIVMIHGLGSSPEAWVSLTNNIMGDKELRDHYQVWQVFYSTNMPILESRFQIYELLKHAFSEVIPNTNSAHDAVLIGHSMGGVISRLLVSDADVTEQAVSMMSEQQRHQFEQYPIIRQRFVFKPLTQFDRAVFISAPQRGTPYANLWFTQFIAKRLIKLPVTFLNSVDTNLKSNYQQFKNGLIYNGPGDLSDHSKFMQLTSKIMPVQSIKYYSIMGNKKMTDQAEKTSDGIVPYSSSHLDGAVSEKIIRGGHSIQEKPEAVLELRRILRANLALAE